MAKKEAMNGMDVETPLMKQYNAIKTKHPDAILLFRVGDFYETFGPDAVKTSEILGIVLTKRANGSASFIDLAGFPYHALDTYLPKLVRAGQRVAICEQLEDPKLTKNIVKRGVTELVTPGVSLNDNVLEHNENNFLAAVHIDKKIAGVAFLDISTGEFYTSEGSFEYIEKLLQNFQPKEVVYERNKQQLFFEIFGKKFYSYTLEDWVFTEENASSRLLKQFETNSLKGFGIQNLNFGIIAAGAVLCYLDLTEHDKLNHITKISRIEEDRYVWLDKFTVRNLELFYSLHEGAKTLIDVIDRTISPMGARMLKKWISLPLKDIRPINERLSVVDFFNSHDEVKSEIESYIKQIGDLERIISKVATLRVSPREIVQLKNALSAIAPVREQCLASSNDTLKKIGEQLNPCNTVKERIEREIIAEPPAQMLKGGVISEGINAELDELRVIAYSGKDYLLQMQQQETERTGISSLKIGFNSVFGYYFEVRNTHKDKVPQEWIRKQTLVGAERYINEELKEYETKILGAEEKILTLEQKIFNDLVLYISDFIAPVQYNASLIARLDCMLSFSTIALQNNYTKPEINDSLIIDIKNGRHPVIEKQLPIGEEYIPNDVFLDTDEQQIIIITGPNMAGKSALLRQIALITLMAQMGSYVPASSAKIGVVDKIFTRVGASDNISLGESTFMVEMNEAASILNNLSSRSLILLDELGRGTSTYDGISIAWAIAEYIHEHPAAKAKTLFATHYHELNEMENNFSRIKNYNVTVKEYNNKVIFLRKLVRGGSEHSFGIHVARMAGMPKSVVSRANEILKELEESHQKKTLTKPVADIASHREGYQLSFFQLEDPVLKQIRDEIKNLDVNNLTPIEALNKLNEIKKISGI
ncbi:MAG: DNA mismatch repair protein MutS [Bacteroidetes bacterium RIFOXYA12_FULL_35_11]|nr:MAG: DNA mismatch repair protein MutS [Bacteroidetes bacterium GWF2_35_48]OFY78099.1 MAG: DNA mismatch repair protein MutS [Bacteroidetes bacterium RIFOXYA12_FULL_35_11]OFY98079.1 MAG: DNA mismatch repair protein MutS [Bacteroidetes bacterium RIFOXYC12_FULL_35_7]HBX53720.1 DNA mismatch repair protein MutS [Bacteroidales bacterium]